MSAENEITLSVQAMEMSWTFYEVESLVLSCRAEGTFPAECIVISACRINLEVLVSISGGMVQYVMNPLCNFAHKLVITIGNIVRKCKRQVYCSIDYRYKKLLNCNVQKLIALRL